MAQAQAKWTKKRIAKAKKILSESRTLNEAARKLGFDDGDKVVRAFARAREPHPRDFLKPPPAPTDIPAARERARQVATAADVRKLQARLVEAEEAADFYSKLFHVPSIKVDGSRAKNGKREATPVTIASDWHVGEVVTLEETLGRNAYDLKEAKRRAANFWDNVLWLRDDAKRTQTCRDHVLNLNGDMISGSIHPELLSTNEVELVEQVSIAASLIRPGIEALAADSRQLFVICTHGNHGRVTEKSRIKTGWANSLETMLYRLLRAELASKLPNVEWIIPRAEGAAIDVHDYRLQAQHGTQIRSQGGIGGILVPLNRWATRANCAHYYLFGHFHQAECFGKVVVNGSLIGESAYSKWLGLDYREPEQVNFMIDARRGLRRFDRVSVT